METGGDKHKLLGKDGVKTVPEDGSVLKKRNESKPSLSLEVLEMNTDSTGCETVTQTDSFVPSQKSQKGHRFRKSMKMSRRLWTSIDQGSTSRKKQLPKSREKSMDDGMLFAGDKESDDEDISLEAFNQKERRGSICEEMEKKIFQGDLSLYEMRKAMVIEETLRERFI